MTFLLPPGIKGLKFTNIFCWCDSQIVLWWLKLQKEWKLWVQNRVRIVRKNVSPDNWFYIATNSNPADVATRVRSPSCFSSCSLWWQGPEFLCSCAIEIPSQQFLEPRHATRGWRRGEASPVLF